MAIELQIKQKAIISRHKIIEGILDFLQKIIQNALAKSVGISG